MNWNDPQEVREYNRRWYQKNIAENPNYYKERYGRLSAKAINHRNEYHKKARADKTKWIAIILSHIKNRAKNKGIEFSLRHSDIVIPDVCPVLGIPIILGSTEKGARNPNAPSIDRFDNSCGYTPSNIRVISNRANHLKNNAAIDELKAIVRYMEDFK